MMAERGDYTPALGYRVLTPLYDTAIALATREHTWRRRLLDAIDLKAGERLLDAGCGTGSLIAMAARLHPSAIIAGIDPDPDVLKRAQAKVRRSPAGSAPVALHNGFLDDGFLAQQGSFDAITSSLVFHQVPLEGKRELFRFMLAGLKPGGRLLAADYGLQRTRLMRFLFGATVQRLDGKKDTQPNADGILPMLMASAGFSDVSEIAVFPTMTGSISIYRARAHGGQEKSRQGSAGS